MKGKGKLRGVWGLSFLLLGGMGLFVAPKAKAAEDLQVYVTAAEIRYGQRLANSALEGYALLPDADIREQERIEGSFVWEKPDKVMQKTGSAEESYIFTPDSPQYAPVEGIVSVTVQPGQTRVKKWPEITFAAPLYHGDTLSQAVTLQGGEAVCLLQTAPESREEAVAGNFVWEEPGQTLRAGQQTVKLKFEPADPATYASVSSEVKLEASPRPVKLSLEASGTRLLTQSAVRLTASVSKEDPVLKPEGNVTFYVNDAPIASPVSLTDEPDAFRAVTEWTPSAPGTYAIRASYRSVDGTTADADSRICYVEAADPMSAILTETLRDAIQGKPYQSRISTDASGFVPVTFSLQEGDLPDGILLESDTGRIYGTPTETGDSSFTIQAREGDRQVSRSYRLSVTANKRKANLTVQAEPAVLTAGGSVTLKISIRDSQDGCWNEELATALEVKTDPETELLEALDGKEGDYTYRFQVKEQNAKILCTVTAPENDYYLEAKATAEVTVQKPAPPMPKPQNESGQTGSRKEKEPEPPPVKTPEEVEADFWQSVIDRINKAQAKAETVTINAKGHTSLPDTVLDALRKNTGVTLALVWEKDMIVIGAGQAPPWELSRKTWTLEELSLRYPLPSLPTADSTPQSAPAPPQTPVSPKPVIRRKTAEETIQESTEAEEIFDAVSQSEENPAETQTQTKPARTQKTEKKATETQHPQISFDLFFCLIYACVISGLIAILIAVVEIYKKYRADEMDEYEEYEEYEEEDDEEEEP